MLWGILFDIFLQRYISNRFVYGKIRGSYHFGSSLKKKGYFHDWLSHFTVVLSAFTAAVFKLLSFVKSGLTFKKFLLLEIPLAVLALIVTFRIGTSDNRTDAFNYSYSGAASVHTRPDFTGDGAAGNPVLSPSLIEQGYGELYFVFRQGDHSIKVDPYYEMNHLNHAGFIHTWTPDDMPLNDGTMYFKKDDTYYIHPRYSLIFDNAYPPVIPKDLTPMDDVLNGEEFIPLYAAN